MPEIVRFSKPAPPHNSLYAPGVCGCVECCKVVLDSRCPFTSAHPFGAEGILRCGDYKGHRGAHTTLVATIFLIAEERVRLDGREGLSEQ